MKDKYHKIRKLSKEIIGKNDELQKELEKFPDIFPSVMSQVVGSDPSQKVLFLMEVEKFMSVLDKLSSIRDFEGKEKENEN